jgi:uncharacterized protein (PEP-CTERM system associated)
VSLRAAVCALLLAALAAGEGHARSEFTPRATVRELVDLGLDADVFTASTDVAIGGALVIERNRVDAQIDYSYGRRFVQAGTIARDDRHSLLARLSAELVEDRLTIGAGATGALVSRDNRGDIALTPDADTGNQAQTWSFFVAPRWRQNIGDFAALDLRYQASVFEVDDARGDGGLQAGDIARDDAAGSVSQNLTAALRNRAQSQRIRWSVTADLTREDGARLDQRFASDQFSAEFGYAFTRRIALLANAGWERNRNSQIGFVTDAAGNPVPGRDGRFQPDANLPRTVLLDEDGLTYGGGITWTPSRRTNATVRIGKRYGDFNIAVEAGWRMSERLGLRLSFRQSIESAGRLLTRNVGDTPVSFFLGSGDVGALGGCVFGADPTTGGCLFGATQSVTGAQFKSDEGQFTLGGQKGRTRYTLAASYSKRRYFGAAALQDPGAPAIDPTLATRADVSWSANARLDQQFGDSLSAGLGLLFNDLRFALADSRHDQLFGGVFNLSWRVGQSLSIDASANYTQRYSDEAPDRASATVAAGASVRFR